VAQTLASRELTNPFYEPAALAPTASARTAQAESLRQRAAIAKLTRSHEQMRRQVKAVEQRAEVRTRRLSRRLASTERHAARVEERSRLHAAYAREARHESARLRDRVQALETDNQIDQVMSIVGALQATAFGDSGSLTTASNLLLLGNQLAWTQFDPLMRSMEIYSGPTPTAFKWLKPFGSLATGHLLLAGRQHVRFVSGTTSLVPVAGATVTESLRSRIAEDLWPSFQRRTDVPVTVVSLDPVTPPLSGLVRDGELRITVPPPPGVALLAAVPPPPPAPPPAIRVAWMIDTGAGRG